MSLTSPSLRLQQVRGAAAFWGQYSHDELVGGHEEGEGRNFRPARILIRGRSNEGQEDNMSLGRRDGGWEGRREVEAGEGDKMMEEECHREEGRGKDAWME